MGFWEPLFFWIFALGAVVSSGAVVVFRNPLYSALALILDFFFFAGLYALLSAHFMAIAQILVYAGAIMVLFLFIIMLLNLKEEELGTFEFHLHHLLSVGAAVGMFFFFATAIVQAQRGVDVKTNRAAAVKLVEANTAKAAPAMKAVEAEREAYLKALATWKTESVASAKAFSAKTSQLNRLQAQARQISQQLGEARAAQRAAGEKGGHEAEVQKLAADLSKVGGERAKLRKEIEEAQQARKALDKKLADAEEALKKAEAAHAAVKPDYIVRTPSPVAGLHQDLSEEGLRQVWRERIARMDAGEATMATDKYPRYATGPDPVPPALTGKALVHAEGYEPARKPAEFGEVEPMSLLMVNRFVVAFELAALLLLAAIIGAVIIAKRRI